MNASRLHSSQLLSLIPTQARHELGGFLERAGWPGEPAPVLLAVHEAFANAHRHGGGVTAACVRLGEDLWLEVEVRDRGPRFDPAGHTRRPADPLAEGGRGLWLMSRVASDCQVRRRRGENRVVLVFRP